MTPPLTQSHTLPKLDRESNKLWRYVRDYAYGSCWFVANGDEAEFRAHVYRETPWGVRLVAVNDEEALYEITTRRPSRRSERKRGKEG